MRPHPAALVHEIGHTLGRITAGLKGFDHAALTRDFKWHPLQPHWAFTEVFEILDEDIKSLINEYFHLFENNIESELIVIEGAGHGPSFKGGLKILNIDSLRINWFNKNLLAK